MARIGSAADLSFIPDASLDLVFASNLLEHLSHAECAECLESVREKLKVTGRLVILQPNFRYAFREYFDDDMHRTIWTDVSITDFLAAHSFLVEAMHPRFLPLSLKSRLPVWPFLIRIYLRLTTAWIPSRLKQPTRRRRMRGTRQACMSAPAWVPNVSIGRSMG